MKNRLVMFYHLSRLGSTGRNKRLVL